VDCIEKFISHGFSLDSGNFSPKKANIAPEWIFSKYVLFCPANPVRVPDRKLIALWGKKA
jgi:hypothetical protein